MAKFTQKYSLISMLEPVNEGLEFFWKDYPLHVTLASVFYVDWNNQLLMNQLNEILSKQKPIRLTATREEHWGENKEYHMVLLEKSSAIMDLHRSIVTVLLNAGAVFNEPQYTGDGFVPHATIQKHTRLNVGDSVTISDLTILDMFPGGDGYRRKLLQSFVFGG